MCKKFGSSIHLTFYTVTQEIDFLFYSDLLWPNLRKVASINYVDKQGGEGLSQMSTLLHKLMK